MIDLEFLERLIRSIDASSIDTIEIERGGTRIRVSKTPDRPSSTVQEARGYVAPPASQPNAQPLVPNPVPADPDVVAPSASEGAAVEEERGSDWLEITSPMVGTFYRAPAPGADPFAVVGDRISKGDTLCIIEAMKLMNELEAEIEGVVREVCVENGEPVEYGQLLFRVEPA